MQFKSITILIVLAASSTLACMKANGTGAFEGSKDRYAYIEDSGTIQCDDHKGTRYDDGTIHWACENSPKHAQFILDVPNETGLFLYDGYNPPSFKVYIRGDSWVTEQWC